MPGPTTPLTRLRAWQVFALVAIVYALLAHLGEGLLPPDGIAALWPASGFAAVMLLWAATPRRRVVVIVAIIVGIGLSIALRHVIFRNELGYLIGNLVEPVIMLPFLIQAVRPTGLMDRLTHVAWLCFGAVVSTSAAAMLVASMATWSFDGTGDTTAWVPTWISFFTGDLLGLLLVAPVLLQLQPPSRLWCRGSLPEQSLLWGALLLTFLAASFDPIFAGLGLIVAIVMALRLDSSAAALAALIVSSTLIVAFLRGVVTVGLTGVTVLDVRLVLPLIAVVTLIVAMGTSERRAAEAEAARLQRVAEDGAATLDAVLSSVPVGIALYEVELSGEGARPEFRLEFINEFGSPRGSTKNHAAVDSRIDEHVPALEGSGIYEHFAIAWAEGAARSYLLDNRGQPESDGRVYSATVLPLGNDRLLVEWSDVTDLDDARKAAEVAAREAERSRATLRNALDSGLDAFAIFAHRERGWELVFVNAAGASRSLSSADEMIGAPPEHVIPVEAIDQVVQLMDLARTTNHTQETMADLTNSHSGWRGDFDVAVTPISDERVVVTWRDVSELQTAYRTMRSAHAAAMHAATHDPLTNLPNRPLLLDRMVTALATMQRSLDRMGVAFIDIDNFKLLNDRHGHAFGDAVLVSVARRLRELTREGDTAARIGGDEFVLILTGLTDDWNREAFQDRITAAMTVPVDHDGVSLHVSLSVGLAVTDGTQTSPEELLNDADLALYASKRSGHGRFTVFTQGLRPREFPDKPTSGDLEQGLERGDLLNAYQPIVGLSDGQVVGYEALVRWQHPRLGMLAPGQFLDLAEVTGLISPLGRGVMDRAIRDLAGWPEPTWVSVNLAPTQLLRSDVWLDVSTWCEAADVAPSRLVLELTEAQLLEATPAVLRQLDRLRKAGCRIAIDDFGTGYSSIAYLESFDVDIIKIDQALIRGELTERKRAMVRWIVDLAGSLDCVTIAEGIETQEQADLAAEAGVMKGQGYFFGRPAPLGGHESLS